MTQMIDVVSIPLEQGRVFRRAPARRNRLTAKCFNPFGAGQGLSTCRYSQGDSSNVSFNPFGAGQGLSTAGVVWCLAG